MNNNERFDYYDNSFSYVKVIMKNLKNEKKNLETLVMREIFNEMVNDMDSNSIYKMLIVSSLFEKKLNSLGKVERDKLIDDLHSCYIRPMILNFANNEMEMTKYFYDCLNNKVTSLSGFYGLFCNNLEMFQENAKNSK